MLFFVLSWIAACGESESPPVEVREGCNPIASEWHCLAPFPSDVFLVEDSGVASSRRVEVTEQAALRTVAGVPMELWSAHPIDGFPKLPQIVVALPFDIDPTALVFHDDPHLAEPISGVFAVSSTGSGPVHEGIRRLPAVHRMMDRFLSPTGLAENLCDGSCDPE